MILYAIKEQNTGLFVTKYHMLNELGTHTELFKDRERAERAISTSDEFGMMSEPIRNNLTWIYLENKYKTNRMNIDISYKEYYSIRDQIDLIVVPIKVKEIEEADNDQ